MKVEDLLKVGFVLIVVGILGLLFRWEIAMAVWPRYSHAVSGVDKVQLFSILTIVVGGICVIKAFFDKSKKEK